MPAKGWFEVLKRSWREMGQDNLSLIASGVAFYAILAMAPLLRAIQLTEAGGQPASIVRHFRQLSTMPPPTRAADRVAPDAGAA